MASDRAQSDDLTTWGERHGMLVRLTGGLHPTQKLLLIILHNFVGSRAGAWPSQETLAELAGCSVKSVQRHIRVLSGRHNVADGEESPPVFLHAMLPGEDPPEGVSGRIQGAARACSTWYVFDWQTIQRFSPSRPRPNQVGDKLTGRDVVSAGPSQPTDRGDKLTGGAQNADRGGDKLSRPRGSDRPSARSKCPPGGDKLTREVPQEVPQKNTTTTTTNGPGSETGGGVEVVVGILQGAGVWERTARRLAALAHVDAAYAERTVASVRASLPPGERGDTDRIGKLVRSRLDSGLEPTVAGDALLARERDEAAARERLEGREIEKRLSAESEKRRAEDDRMAMLAWRESKTPAEVEALRRAYLATLGDADRRVAEGLRTGGGAMTAALMDFEAATAREREAVA